MTLFNLVSNLLSMGKVKFILPPNRIYFPMRLFPRSHPIGHNVYVYAVWGIGGLKNEAQRNVKPDLLRTVPRDRTTL